MVYETLIVSNQTTFEQTTINSATLIFSETKWISNLLLEIVRRLDQKKSGSAQCVIPAQTVLFLIGHHAPDQLNNLASLLAAY